MPICAADMTADTDASRLFSTDEVVLECLPVRLGAGRAAGH